MGNIEHVAAMDGNFGGRGVTLINGTSTTGGESFFTLINGSRAWRFRIPSAQESFENALVLEVKQGRNWYPAQHFVVTDD